MQPSSLIFVAIIAIWAAFLVQHWVRRREALARLSALRREDHQTQTQTTQAQARLGHHQLIRGAPVRSWTLDAYGALRGGSADA